MKKTKLFLSFIAIFTICFFSISNSAAIEDVPEEDSLELTQGNIDDNSSESVNSNDELNDSKNTDDIVKQEDEILNGWVCEGEGYWKYYIDGQYLVSQWEQIDDSYYYFKEDGYRIQDKEYYSIDGKVYGFDYDGRMITGWSNSSNYYYKENGEMIFGCYDIDGTKYLFNEKEGYICRNEYSYVTSDGVYMTDENGIVSDYAPVKEGFTKYENCGEWTFIENGKSIKDDWKKHTDGFWYYFDYSGLMVNNVAAYEINGKCYGFNDSGHMLNSGWHNFSEEYEDWHYYFSDGQTAFGETLINGESFLFCIDGGQLLTNYNDIQENTYYRTDERGVIRYKKEITQENGWIQLDDEQWAYVENGIIIKNQWKEIDGNLYYFEWNGFMANQSHVWIEDKTYGFQSNGLIITGWFNEYDETFYYFSTGELATGIQEIDGKRYFFSDDNSYGNLQIDVTCFTDGKIIITNNDGEIISEKTVVEGWNQAGSDYYYIEDGEVVRNQWKEIDGYLYYFIYNGKMANESHVWIEDGYYGFKTNGKVITGWYEDEDNLSYYYFSDGKLATGIQEINGINYLFEEEWGALLQNHTSIIDNRIIITDNNGVIIENKDIQEGWNSIGNKWCYVENGDIVQSDWRFVGGYWYYLDWDGFMICDDSYWINDQEYYFDKNGHMRTGWYNVNEDDDYDPLWKYLGSNGKPVTGKNQINGNNYLFDDDGYLLENCEVIIDNVYYETNSRGIIIVEKVISDGWIQIKDDWYYVDNKKIVTNSWKQINNAWYYFNEYGKMLSNEMLYDKDNYVYVFATNGQMIINGWHNYDPQTGEGWSYIINKHAVDGVKTINGKKYLFKNYYLSMNYSGVYNDQLCATNSSGVITQLITPNKNGWHGLDGEWYYYDDGFVQDRWLYNLNGYDYYIDSDYRMVKNQNHYQLYEYDYEIDDYKEYYYAFDANGHLIKDKWLRNKYDLSDWYYYDTNGNGVDGWQVIDENNYYFDNYTMCVDVKMIDDVYHLFDESGKYIGIIDNTDGWNLYGGQYYYIANGKVLREEWKNIDGVWYYLNSSGIMLRNTIYTIEQNDHIVIYAFNKSGSMISNQWILSNDYDGYWDFRVWLYAGGNGKLLNGWQKINNSWYFFDEFKMTDSDMIIDNVLYHFNSNGVWDGTSSQVTSLNGWIKSNNYWYYYKNGVKQTGWQLINNKWYYLEEETYDSDEYYGSMQIDVIEDDEKLYFMDANGVMQKNGWFKTTYGLWVYVDVNGRVLTGWQKINNVWYYLNPEMVDVELYEIDGKYYRFNSNGQYIGEYKPTLGWNKINSSWYYFTNENSQVSLIRDNYIELNGSFYMVDYYGRMVSNTIYNNSIIDANGKIIFNDWYNINGKWYYADRNGKIYFNETRIINGIKYTFDIYGAMI